MSQEIKRVILEEAAMYNSQLSELTLRMWSQEYQNIPPEKLREAYRSIRKGRRQIPLPADVFDALKPEAAPEAQAIESVNRILLAINRFGYPNPTEAKEFIGELGWLVVKDYGGWDSLCANMGVEYSEQTFRAQARESIKSKMNLAKAGVLNQPIGLPGSSDPEKLETRKGLLSLADLPQLREIPKKDGDEK